MQVAGLFRNSINIKYNSAERTADTHVSAGEEVSVKIRAQAWSGVETFQIFHARLEIQPRSHEVSESYGPVHISRGAELVSDAYIVEMRSIIVYMDWTADLIGNICESDAEHPVVDPYIFRTDSRRCDRPVKGNTS